MTATINSMYRKVDQLYVDQLEINDLISIDDEVVQIIEITPLREGYAITYQNDFGEKDIVEFDDYAKFDLFVLDN